MSEFERGVTHALQLRGRPAELEQRAAQRRVVLERKQVAPPAREKLLRVPIRSGHHGRSGPHRIGQRTARDLCLVEVGRHEDVRRLQVLAQLAGRYELAAKRDVLAHAELLGLALEHGSIGLALLPQNGGMRGAHHEVDEIGEVTHHRGQRANHGLDAFVRAQQAERQQQAALRDAELRLERLLIGVAIHHGNAVRNDPHVLAADAVRAREQVPSHLAHDHELRAVGQHLVDDRRLIRRRALEHGVQRHDHRHAQGADEIEDVAAVVAAEDPVLVLNRDQAHGAVVHELRGARVIGFDVLPNLELDLRGILVLARRFGDREHHGQRAPVVTGDSRGEIGGEGCNAAAARAVRADERHGNRAIERLPRSEKLLAAGVLARLGTRAMVVRNKELKDMVLRVQGLCR